MKYGEAETSKDWITPEWSRFQTNLYINIFEHPSEYIRLIQAKQKEKLPRAILKEINESKDPKESLITLQAIKKFMLKNSINLLQTIIKNELATLNEEIKKNIEKNLNNIEKKGGKDFPEITNNGKITGFWKKIRQEKGLNKEVKNTINIFIANLVEDNKLLVLRIVDEKFTILPNESVSGSGYQMRPYNFDILSERMVLNECLKIFREKIKNEIYQPIEEKRLSSIKKDPPVSKPKKKKLLPYFISKIKNTTSKKEKLPPEQERVMQEIINFFSELAKTQGKNIDEKVIRRILLKKSKNENLIEHLGKRFGLELPQKHDMEEKEWHPLIFKAEEFGWSISTKKNNNKVPPTKSVYKKSSKKYKPKKSRSNKLYKEISEKEELSFDDFKKAINFHNVFKTNQRAFIDFQKEFNTREQKDILLYIIKNKHERSRHKSNGKYYYKFKLSNGFRIVASAEDQIVKYFYRNHESYMKRVRGKGF